MTQQWYRTETVINKGTTKGVRIPLSPQKETHNVCCGFFISQKNQTCLCFLGNKKDKILSKNLGFYAWLGFPNWDARGESRLMYTCLSFFCEP